VPRHGRSRSVHDLRMVEFAEHENCEPGYSIRVEGADNRLLYVTVGQKSYYDLYAWSDGVLLVVRPNNVVYDTCDICILCVCVCVCVAAVTACVFCVCVVNWHVYDGIVELALNITICVSAIILLTAVLMLSRLPQAVESLPFKVRRHCFYFLARFACRRLRAVSDVPLRHAIGYNNLFFRCLSFLLCPA